MPFHLVQRGKGDLQDREKGLRRVGGSLGPGNAEETAELVRGNEDGRSGDVADDDGTAHVLDQIAHSKERAEDEEEPGEEHQHRQVEETVRGGEGGELGEKEEGGRIGRPQNGVARSGEEWGDDRGDRPRDDPVLDRQVGDGGVGHPLGKGEERDIEARGGVGAEVSRTILAEAMTDRQGIDRVLPDKTADAGDGPLQQPADSPHLQRILLVSGHDSRKTNAKRESFPHRDAIRVRSSSPAAQG